HFDVVKWLDANVQGLPQCSWEAAENGHLEIVKFLHERGNTRVGLDLAYVDRIVLHGHLDVIQWLHANNLLTCSNYVMDSTAVYGHLDLVQWLRENHYEGCTNYAIVWAAGNGHLEVIKWLHENRQYHMHPARWIALR
uniref:Ankyrin repeat protein n=1 Tax=Globisporangium ultimum (strain ATCC 200006 / CBS 805.95 / DAOM BR144) TaxID=431595 RepID=K3WNV6_GLOUD